MGGAVAYSIVRDHPNTYAGVVFQCPMCKISDDMLPPNWVIQVFQAIMGPSGTVGTLGFLPVAPTKGNLAQLAFKLKHKMDLVSRSPANFRRNPRLATARELLVSITFYSIGWVGILVNDKAFSN
jgi:alpha-beta hydrolase superfamily lysophospholipase